MYTVKELLERYYNNEWPKCVNIEVYRYCFLKSRGIHTDVIESLEDNEFSVDEKVSDWAVMTEEDYENSVYANVSIKTDFLEWYGDKDVQVLVIVLPFKAYT